MRFRWGVAFRRHRELFLEFFWRRSLERIGAQDVSLFGFVDLD